MNCAPGHNNGSTCYTKEQLIKMAHSVYPKYTIGYLQKMRKDKLWVLLNNKFATECDKESCWLDKDVIKKIPDTELHYYTFRPKKPKEWNKDRYTWLTTTDIYKVMNQYQRAYKNFIFMGAVPVDCPSAIQCELSNINVERLEKNNINKIGIIFNLDKHDEPGSHWVALYIDRENGRIEYYDSVGSSSPQMIKKFMKSLRDKYNDIGIKMILKENKRKHQRGSSECGVYSMNFLIECLTNNKSLKDFEKRDLKDKTINLLRDYLYRQ